MKKQTLILLIFEMQSCIIIYDYIHILYCIFYVFICNINYYLKILFSQKYIFIAYVYKFDYQNT